MSEATASTTPSTTPRRVVILGGGVGGLSTAVALRAHLADGDTITVVARDATHVQGLSLLWVLRGWRRASAVTVEPSAQALAGIDLLEAEVQQISVAERRVITSEATLEYDALVIALGSELHIDGVPGLAAGLASGAVGEFYTLQGASAAHQRLSEIRSGRVAVVVASVPYKCPAAPWEAAFLTADLLGETGSRGAVDVSVYTPEPQPMPVAGPFVGGALEELLDEHGIGYQFGAQLVGIDPAARILQFGDATQAEFDYALVIPPHRAPSPVRAAGFSEPGWIPVDPRTLATSTAGVWAIGDNASITLTNGRPLPKAAVFARGQAQAVAAGVAHHLGRTAPHVVFDGVGACYVEIGGHVAAKGAGDFYADRGPVVELLAPSRQMHEEKELEEATWLARWAR
jgi:sulfide:quinone oxidoreductase